MIEAWSTTSLAFQTETMPYNPADQHMTYMVNCALEVSKLKGDEKYVDWMVKTVYPDYYPIYLRKKCVEK